MIQASFWDKKKVLVTGHTGFKGGWLSTWLLEMGADLVGYALKPNTDPSFFAACELGHRFESVTGDVRDKDRVLGIVRSHRPEIIFHLAAQSLVRQSYREPEATFATNVMGTVHLLEAVRENLGVRVVVNVTSDKCYENREWIWAYRENEPMGGHDPYSASKGCAELVTSAYRRSFFDGASHAAAVATARAGNVIGGGDWAEDRIVPDAIRSLHQGKPLIVRHPQAIRPWQHVLEPLQGYLLLAERLYHEREKWVGAWNFGPRDESGVTVASLADMLVRRWGKGSWQSAAEPGTLHEAQSLKLDSGKARHLLGWRACLTLEDAVKMAVDWYRAALSAESTQAVYQLTCDQIKSYLGTLKGAEAR